MVGRRLLVVLSRRLVKFDRDYRFDTSRRLLVTRTPLAERAYRRLDRHFHFAWRSGVIDAATPHWHAMQRGAAKRS